MTLTKFITGLLWFFGTLLLLCLFSCKNFKEYHIEQKIETNIFDNSLIAKAYLKTTVYVKGNTAKVWHDEIDESDDSVKIKRLGEAKLFIEKCKCINNQ